MQIATNIDRLHSDQNRHCIEIVDYFLSDFYEFS